MKPIQFPELSARQKWLVKGLISLLIIYLLYTQMDWKAFANVLKQANLWWLSIAGLLFAFSKLLSAERFRALIQVQQRDFDQSKNLKLYWKSMYYNLLLPGGISGDAYKMKVLSQQLGCSIGTLFKMVLADRLSGLIALFQWMLVLMLFIDYFNGYQWLLLLLLGMLIVFSFYYLKVFKDGYHQVNTKMFFYSLAVQAAQILSASCIIFSLKQNALLVSYMALFLASSLAAMIPLTIGGAGARELCFMYGAPIFGGSAAGAAAIGFVFYLISTIVSLTGMIWVYRDVE